MSAMPKCPSCGRILDAHAPEGLYPACLLSQNVLTDTPGATAFTPPSPAELAAPFPQLEIIKLIGKGARPYADVGAELGMSEGAVKVAVHRLRHRYRDVLKMEIAQTLSVPGQLEEELQALRRALAG